MKKLLFSLIMIAFVFGLIQNVHAADERVYRWKDLTGTEQLTLTVDSSGNLTLASAGSGATIDFDDLNITTTGTVTYPGVPGWSLNNSQVLDDGVTNSPYWGCQDASDELGYMYKIDSSHLILYNDTAADGIGFMAGGDTDDYPLFTTTTNVPYLTTVGSCVLGIKPSGDLYLMPDSETDDYVSWSSSGTAITMGIVGGADLVITHDTDAYGIDFQLGGDTNDSLRLYTTGNESTFATAGDSDLNILTASAELNLKAADADDYISVGIKTSDIPALKLNGCTQMDLLLGDADDYLSFSSSGNENTITAQGASDLNITVGASNYVDFTAGGIILADDEYFTNASDVVGIYADDAAATLDVVGYENFGSGLILTADQGDEAQDRWKILANDSATATMVIQNDSAIADTFVTVATFGALGDLTLAGTTPVLTIGDGGTEDTGIVFDGVADWYCQIDDTGGIAEDMLTIGTGSTVGTNPVLGVTSAQLVYIANTDSTANAVEDMLVIYKAVNGATHGSNGLGAGIVFNMEDAAANEEQASIDAVFTDVTDAGEEVDFVFSQNSAGAIGETLRLVAAKSGTTGDYIKFTSQTTETDGILDVISLTTAAVTGAAGMGLGITFDYCDAGGAEEQGSIDNVLTTATNGSEISDWVFSQQSAGAVAETLRLVGGSSGTTSDYLQFTANTTETDAATNVLVLKTATGTAEDNYGMSISFQPEDGTGSEEVARIDIIETTAARATNNTDFVFPQNVNGTITERVRFDADGSNIVLSGANPALTIGDDGEEDTKVLWLGAEQDYYAGIDDTDNALHIGAGTAVGTTPAISIATTQVATFAQTAVFSGGQTKKHIIHPSDVTLDSGNPPNLTFNGTAAQWEWASLEFDGNGANGDDICYISWIVPDGYVTDSARLNVYWSYDTAETDDDDVVFDMTVNAVAPGLAAAGGDALDAAGSDFTQGDTNLDNGDGDEGKLIVTQLNIEVEEIVVDDIVFIKFWVDESESDLDQSGTLDVHWFEIEWESTE
jgi:hypothetical protein